MNLLVNSSMLKIKRKYIRIFLTLFLISSCSVPDVEDDIIKEKMEEEVEKLSIPDGFDFSTYREITINIFDNEDYIKYDVFAYSEELYNKGEETYENQSGEIVTETVYKNDIVNKLVFSGVPVKGVLSQKINIPKFCAKLYIRRNENLNYSSSIVNIVNGEVNYTHSNKRSKGKSSNTLEVNDYLFCVNGSGELFQVDPIDGALTYLSDMPMGSWTCAIDQETKTLYSIGRSSPYPLMKYYIDTNTWEIVANLGIGGPRLDFNINDRLLYFSRNDKLYTFDPDTGENLEIWNILGLHNTSGGDLVFAEDGTLFLCTFSGLYRLDLNSNNDYQSTRISADNLPFQPTSMTFDSNQELWLANNASSSDLIIMDTQTGGWQYRFGISAQNNTDFGRTINDLTTFRVYNDVVIEIDTDGDGVLDRDDKYPEDANKAFELFTPSKFGTGTIAFEDLWPSQGDYDFNDMALNYQAIVILNSQNLAVQLDFICNVKSNGAGFKNGVGFEINGLSPMQIESVNGNVVSHDYINFSTNGTEANQSNAVIILTDDADYLLNETVVSIKFKEPISTIQLGSAPFNPFIIANSIREREIHLPYHTTTSLGNSNINFDGVNMDPGGNFVSSKGFPWGISIIHDFKVPKESIRINNAYNFFNEWAVSGGVNYNDWYKDNPGYRNQDKIKN